MSDDVCKELRQNLKHLKLLVIDEISMVSSLMLTYVHMRLNQILNLHENIPFAGLNVIVMGDLAQLRPVGDKPVFMPLTVKEVQTRIGGFGKETNLWEYFEYDELTISMRQKSDPVFGALLNRLRFGQTTAEDMKLLQTRLIEVPSGASPLAAFAERYTSLRSAGKEPVCLMSKAVMVSKFNEYMLLEENKDIVEIRAIDGFQYNGRPGNRNK